MCQIANWNNPLHRKSDSSRAGLRLSHLFPRPPPTSQGKHQEGGRVDHFQHHCRNQVSDTSSHWPRSHSARYQRSGFCEFLSNIFELDHFVDYSLNYDVVNCNAWAKYLLIFRLIWQYYWNIPFIVLCSNFHLTIGKYRLILFLFYLIGSQFFMSLISME